MLTISHTCGFALLNEEVSRVESGIVSCVRLIIANRLTFVENVSLRRLCKARVIRLDSFAVTCIDKVLLIEARQGVYESRTEGFNATDCRKVSRSFRGVLLCCSSSSTPVEDVGALRHLRVNDDCMASVESSLIGSTKFAANGMCVSAMDNTSCW